VAAANRPGLRSFAENYEIEPDGDGTLFTWTIALEPAGRLAPVMKALGPVNKAAFGQVVRAGQKYFAQNG
jgi:hypothetical protein